MDRQHRERNDAMTADNDEPTDAARKAAFARVLHGHHDWLANHPANPRPDDGRWNAGFSFECGPGWSGLLARLFNDLGQILRPTGDRIAIRQLKEKFGTLRVYWRGAVDEAIGARIDDAILLAAFRSEVTCDVCGDPGQMRRNGFGYYHVACDTHAGPDNRTVAGDVIGQISGNRSANHYSETIYDPVLDRMTRRVLTRAEFEALTAPKVTAADTMSTSGDET
jgi:hypothetical protein